MPKTILKKPFDENLLVLIRHELGSIDLKDVEDEKPLSETEQKEYVAAIAAVFPRLEKDIKKFLYEQLMFTVNEAETWERTIFGRGTFNGMDLLLQHWKKAFTEQASKGKEDNNFDKTNPIGEV